MKRAAKSKPEATRHPQLNLRLDPESRRRIAELQESLALDTAVAVVKTALKRLHDQVVGSSTRR